MRKKKKKKTLIDKIREFETYDRVYYDGKLSSALIVMVSFILIILIGVLIWMI